VTAAELLHAGCGAALAAAATDPDAAFAGVARDALRRLAGVDSSTAPPAGAAVLARAIDAGFHAIAAASNDVLQQGDDHRGLEMSERDHMTAVLLQVAVDAIAPQHPDCGAHANAARTPGRLHSIARTLAASAITPGHPIADTLAALGRAVKVELS
jgi:hypothetical protein